MKQNTVLNKISKELTKNKKLLFFAALLLIGLLAVILSPREEANTEKSEETLEEYKIRLEEELARLCTSVEGVGRCTVTVSFKRGVENTYKGTHLVESKPPEILGVTVVCRGAESDTVRRDLTELFTSLFNIPANRVAILKLN